MFSVPGVDSLPGLRRSLEATQLVVGATELEPNHADKAPVILPLRIEFKDSLL